MIADLNRYFFLSRHSRLEITTMVTEVHESPSSPLHPLVATEEIPPAENKAKEEVHKKNAVLPTETSAKTSKTTPIPENVTSGTEDIIITDQVSHGTNSKIFIHGH